jgi:hypothetical protein
MSKVIYVNPVCDDENKLYERTDTNDKCYNDHYHNDNDKDNDNIFEEDNYEDSSETNKDICKTILESKKDNHELFKKSEDNESIQSILTDDILNLDPLYFRLTKFLHSKDGENVADILKEILDNLKDLNINIRKGLSINSEQN